MGPTDSPFDRKLNTSDAWGGNDDASSEVIRMIRLQ